MIEQQRARHQRLARAAEFEQVGGAIRARHWRAAAGPYMVDALRIGSRTGPTVGEDSTLVVEAGVRAFVRGPLGITVGRCRGRLKPFGHRLVHSIGDFHNLLKDRLRGVRAASTVRAQVRGGLLVEGRAGAPIELAPSTDAADCPRWGGLA